MKTQAARLLFALFILMTIFFSFLMLIKTLPYFSFRYDVDLLLTKQSVLHHFYWRAAFYTHISFSLIVLLTGGFQFSRFLIFQKPKIHRILGKIYVILVLFICAPSGLVMALHANGGFWARLSFLLTAILWWLFTFLAYRRVIQKDLRKHLAFMYRSYALTLSAISLRLLVMALPYFCDLHGKEMYVTVAWLSWIPNLLIAEFMIKWQTLLK
ncbi:MAG: DUF2306 domain-containing protein [Bacteroidia bacterium]